MKLKWTLAAVFFAVVLFNSCIKEEEPQQWEYNGYTYGSEVAYEQAKALDELKRYKDSIDAVRAEAEHQDWDTLIYISFSGHYAVNTGYSKKFSELEKILNFKRDSLALNNFGRDVDETAWINDTLNKWYDKERARLMREWDDPVNRTTYEYRVKRDTLPNATHRVSVYPRKNYNLENKSVVWIARDYYNLSSAEWNRIYGAGKEGVELPYQVGDMYRNYENDWSVDFSCVYEDGYYIFKSKGAANETAHGIFLIREKYIK